MMNLFFLLIPTLMVICGSLMYKSPPKKINGFVGYRTRSSVLNEKTWLFANRYCGQLWLLLGTVIELLSATAVILLAVTKTEVSASVCLAVEAVEILVMPGSIILVEIKLKHHFDENDKRR